MKAINPTHQDAPRPSPRGLGPTASPAEAADAAIAEHAALVDAAEPFLSVPPRPTFLRSFVYAGRGLWHALRTQRNMRVHFAAAILALALGVVLRISAVEFAIVFVAIAGVLVAEMFNTVTEALTDLATQDYHPLARVAKDVAAGAVLLSAILAVVIALFVYLPHLWPLLLHLFRH
jgi:diacylglycerol kinase